MENSLDGVGGNEVQFVSGDEFVTDCDELLKEIGWCFEKMGFYLLVEEFGDVTSYSIRGGVMSSFEIFFKFLEFFL